jgi:tRNA(fMet)-specific endonuclease VapC
MYLLDTNHLSILQYGSTAAKRLGMRLEAIDPSQIATTIVSYHEQTQGWLGEANRLASVKPEQQVKLYQRLESTLQIFSTIPVIGFDLTAAEEFHRLRQLHRRIGGMDLRIAAIAITQNATVLTQNLKDFIDIQDLKVEDWSY